MGNDTRWTPGPWETDSNDHDQPYLAYAIRPKKNQWWTICEVWQDDAPVPDYNAEQRANAHLIAAAPELYDALKVAHDNLYALINDPDIGPEVRKLYDLEDVAAMAGPLAKARGEQS